MASVSALRDGLKARLDTISGLRTYDTIPGDLQTPAAVVIPSEPAVTFDDTQSGDFTANFIVQVFGSRSTERTGQDLIDGYISATGASSVKAAVEGDRSLGGIADSVNVSAVLSYGITDVAGYDYWTARIAVEVLA